MIDGFYVVTTSGKRLSASRCATSSMETRPVDARLAPGRRRKVIGPYVIAQDDAADLVEDIPKD